MPKKIDKWQIVTNVCVNSNHANVQTFVTSFAVQISSSHQLLLVGHAGEIAFKVKHSLTKKLHIHLDRDYMLGRESSPGLLGKALESKLKGWLEIRGPHCDRLLRN